MSKLRKRYLAGVGNIKDEKTYDPFPKSGLVRKYAPFIRSEVREYCKMYPNVRDEEMLAEAIRIAVKFEPNFDSNLGNDFSTPLRWHLKGLHRFAQKEFSSWQIPVSKKQRDANDLERKRNGIGGDDPRAVNFSGGGNGARFTLDLQWLTGTPISDRNVSYSQPHRHRIVLGTQLRGRDWDYANGIVDRATPDVKAVLEDRKPSPITNGYIRAVITHSERQQREANQEAENQRNGNYAPVFSQADEQKIDIGFYEGRKPPRLEPDYAPVASLDEAHTDDEGSKTTLHDTTADTAPAESAEAREDELRIEVDHVRFLAAIEAMRPSLNQKETTVLDDWLLGSLTIAEVADKVGMTRGGVSKLAARLEKRLRTKK
jgi:DNA-directed RNA polymerase specialized sigma subunit